MDIIQTHLLRELILTIEKKSKNELSSLVV